LLTKHVGAVGETDLERICAAINYALGC
jgi:hypothetical protein